MNPLVNALWVWNRDNRDGVDQYAEFRHEFKLKEATVDASLYLSVDSDYAVWINGDFVDNGQYDDYPENKSYDCLAVGQFLQEGANVITILAYYQGESTFQYRKGEAGLIYYLEAGNLRIQSGTDTYSRQSNAYTNGLVTRISPQLGFTFEYNAAKGDDWHANSYKKTSDWNQAANDLQLNLNKPKLYARPLHKLVLKERIQARLKTQGMFIRHADSSNTTGWLIQSDFLSYRKPENLLTNSSELELETLHSFSRLSLEPACFRDATGIYLVYDLGQEEAGLFELEVEAESGTVIDIGYGEHLDDLRVRAEVGGRNFAFTYHCRQGKQSFTHYFKRIAGRYIQLNISGVKASFVLHYAGMRPAEYPIEVKGEFHCPDLLHQRIAETSIRTLHLCMHEHYEDTPWREQALYALDSRNQALCGYYCFGEYEFPQASFQLLAESLREDGFLEICAPAECEITIPSFSLMWVVEAAELMLYSGNLSYTATILPYIQRMMDKQISNMQDGLLLTPVDKGYWNFYDWENGLDGGTAIVGIRWDAPLNLMFIMALEAAASMLRACSETQKANAYKEIASSVKQAVHTRFWNPQQGAYSTYITVSGAEHYAELTQALALLAHISADPISGIVRERLASKDNGLVPITLSHSIFKFEALLGDADQYQQLVFKTIGENWGNMLYNGATSFWETKDGSDAFARGGSLCHGWSAVPIYFYYAYLLGVQPVEPGFKVFKVLPTPAGFHRISGSVPTPYGNIEVKWEQTAEGLNVQVTHPEEIKQI